jgi:hypothetical protein
VCVCGADILGQSVVILKYTNKQEFVTNLKIPIKNSWDMVKGMAINSSDKLYVSDASHNRIKVFSE